jgi:DNA-binding transcriptional LysR family regulator
MQNLDWNDLRFVAAVGREGTLSAAARRLGTSVSTVRRRIDAIESALATRLFEKRPDRYVPTDDGREALAIAGEVEASATRLVDRVGGLDRQPSGRVRVSLTETVFHEVLLPRLESFRRAYPDIRLDLSTRPELASLSRREADIAVRLSRPEAGQYIVRRVGSCEFGLYARRDLDLGREAGGAGRLQGVPHLGWPEDLGETVLARCAAAWLTGPPCVTVDTVAGHVAAAKAGVGAAVLPCALAARHSALTRIAADKFTHADAMWAVYHRDLQGSARIRAVLGILEG